MPLFRCEKCGCVENTALSDYWMDHLEKKPAQCSECGTGEWHRRFPKKDAREAGYYTDGKFIYGPDEVDQVKMVWKYNKSFKMKGLA